MKSTILLITLMLSGASWGSAHPLEVAVSSTMNLVLQNVSFSHRKAAAANMREYQRRVRTVRFVVFKKIKTEEDKRSVLTILSYSKTSILKLLPVSFSSARGYLLSELNAVEKSVHLGDWDDVKLRVMPIVRIINNVAVPVI